MVAMVFKLMSMKPNPRPFNIWPISNTGNELVRAVVVEPEPTKNRPSMSRYFGFLYLMRNPLRTAPSRSPKAESVNIPPATSSETCVLLASRISEAAGSAPSMPIAIYVRPNVIKSRRRFERALLSMKHPYAASPVSTRYSASGDSNLHSTPARHVSGRHRSSREKWRSEVLAASCRNTSGSETHCRRARLPSPGERHSAGPCEASFPRVDLLDEEM